MNQPKLNTDVLPQSTMATKLYISESSLLWQTQQAYAGNLKVDSMT